MQLAAAGVAGDLEILPQTAAERSMASSGGGSASYDLVDRVPYLFVRLLKAKKSQDGGDKQPQPLYAQLCIGAHAVRTRAATHAGEWDQVFAFHKASLTASSLEVTVHEEAKKPEKEGEAAPPDAHLGFVSFDLQEVPKRSPPDSALAPQWYTLEGHAEDGAPACDVMLAVWVGTQVGVRGASNLVPMKIAKDGASGSTDAYVVLKYGPKWARTRTILDQFNPRWNEQYAWDVFDPCTVLSIAVFDNARYKMVDAGKPPPKDARIGKLRIRLSTLDTNRNQSLDDPENKTALCCKTVKSQLKLSF
ncbi:hypothetical protein TRIUR3_23632 [Triticum urartu]|uniref:Uncharacterized protein n=1 Tax=Triticum urartu TaxID=4572 RepID=M7YDQ9_TRIUA|nr:hypothetical protein TRIUR3_23632 [Triticum urartu]